MGSLNGPTSINGPAGAYSNVPGSGDQSSEVPAKLLSHALASSLGLDPNLLQQMIDGNLSLMPHFKAFGLPCSCQLPSIPCYQICLLPCFVQCLLMLPLIKCLLLLMSILAYAIILQSMLAFM